MHIVHQAQNFQEMFQVLCCNFNLMNKEEGSQKQSRYYDAFRKVCARIVRHCIFRLRWIFNQKSGGIPGILRNPKLLNFFVDCSIVDAMLVFVPR